MVKNRIEGSCGILDGGLCDKDLRLPVAGNCHEGLALRCCGDLIPFAILFKIVCDLNFRC